MDPDNPVVKLCAEGMQAEGENRPDDARELFEQAWALATDDYEACIAAHYVARHQRDAAAALHWNEVALRRAVAVADSRVAPFYPSLHLNLGRSLELAGDTVAACRHYVLAAERLDALPPSPYASLVRQGVAAGRARVCPPDAGAPGCAPAGEP